MVDIQYTGDELLARIERAVDKVKDRLHRVSRALNDAQIPYAIVGGHAVQFWVAQIDESVVRNTPDVDLILNRDHLARAIYTLEACGFFYRYADSLSKFLDGPDAGARDAVHIVFAGEKVRAEYVEPVPLIEDYEQIAGTRTLGLEALVRMKLTSFRRKDQVHLLDMISIGLIDDTWPVRFHPDLGARLQELLDDPDG